MSYQSMITRLVEAQVMNIKRFQKESKALPNIFGALVFSTLLVKISPHLMDQKNASKKAMASVCVRDVFG